MLPRVFPEASGDQQSEGIERQDVPLTNGKFRLQCKSKKYQSKQRCNQRVARRATGFSNSDDQTYEEEQQQNRRPLERYRHRIVDFRAALRIDLAQEPRSASAMVAECDLAKTFHVLSCGDQQGETRLRFRSPGFCRAIGEGGDDLSISNPQMRNVEQISRPKCQQ